MFPRFGEHISLGICVSQAGEHIFLGICVSQGGEHISLRIRVSQVGEHISLGICISQVGEHISPGIFVCIPEIIDCFVINSLHFDLTFVAFCFFRSFVINS